jgi:biopolymer transport protein ExbD
MSAPSGQSSLLRGGTLGDARSRRLESTFFMINVIFLLLLFFVVAGNLNLHLDVSPPRADSDAPLASVAVQLVIDDKGRIRFDGEELGVPAVAEAVKRAGRVTELTITADAGVDAVLVAQVLEALAGLELDRVTLLTLGRAAPDGG